MTEIPSNFLAGQIREARERSTKELSSQAEQIEKLLEDATNLRLRHQQTTQEVEQRWEALVHAEASLPRISPDTVLENVLGAVRNLMTCTLPHQVLQVLTEEAVEWGVRAAVFDVRGKAAWGAAAKGFGPELAEEAFRSVIIPLSPGNPFQQVCEIAGHVDTNVRALKKNRNILDKLKPAAEDPILLLPIRSAGAVTAILYADPGGKAEPLPNNALKILSEFAGAQLDRLMALSGETLAEGPEEEPGTTIAGEEGAEGSAAAEPAIDEVTENVQGHAGEAVKAEPLEIPGKVAAQADSGAPVPASIPTTGTSEQPQEGGRPPLALGSSAEQIPGQRPSEPARSSLESDFIPLSEVEQKLHKDAKRFAKLLVSEIELYNKVKVADGRKNKDLYIRLKADIERSRQTFDKRFGKILGKEIDPFHEELVRILAANDPTLLGPDYPGSAA